MTSGGTVITEDARKKYLAYKAKHEEYGRLLKAGPHGEKKKNEKKDKQKIQSSSTGSTKSSDSGRSSRSSKSGNSGKSSKSSSSSHHHHRKHRDAEPDLRMQAQVNSQWLREQQGPGMPDMQVPPWGVRADCGGAPMMPRQEMVGDIGDDRMHPQAQFQPVDRFARHPEDMRGDRFRHDQSDSAPQLHPQDPRMAVHPGPQFNSPGSIDAERMPPINMGRFTDDRGRFPHEGPPRQPPPSQNHPQNPRMGGFHPSSGFNSHRNFSREQMQPEHRMRFGGGGGRFAEEGPLPQAPPAFQDHPQDPRIGGMHPGPSFSSHRSFHPEQMRPEDMGRFGGDRGRFEDEGTSPRVHVQVWDQVSSGYTGTHSLNNAYAGPLTPGMQDRARFAREPPVRWQ